MQPWGHRNHPASSFFEIRGTMESSKRRIRIEKILEESTSPISASRLAQAFGVSRQVIVQDVAIIRASGKTIISTTKGYVLPDRGGATRVFKVIHTDEDTREELTTIVDLGGIVEDVFVYHRVYGVIQGRLSIRSRRDIDTYIHEIESGMSRLLKNTTSGYHYHTVKADSEATLDAIQAALQQHGFLAKLQDYEPVDFWNREGSGQVS